MKLFGNRTKKNEPEITTANSTAVTPTRLAEPQSQAPEEKPALAATPMTTDSSTPMIAAAATTPKLDTHEQRLALEAQLTRMASDYRQVKAQLKQQLFAEKQENQDQLAAIQQELTDLESKAQANTEKIATLKAISDANEQAAIDELANELAALAQTTTQEQTHLNGLLKEIDSTTKAIRQVVLEIDENEQASNQLSTEIKAETDLQKMYELMAAQKPQVDALYKKRGRLISTREELNDKFSQLSSQRDDLTGRIDQLNQQNNSKTSQQKQLETALTNKVAERQRELTNADNAGQRLDRQITTASNQVAALTATITGLQEHVTQLFDSPYLLRAIQYDREQNYLVFTPTLTTKANVELALLRHLRETLTTAPTLFTATYQPAGATAVTAILTQAGLTGISVVDLYDQLQTSGENTAPQVELPQNENWIQKVDLEHHTTSIFDKEDHLLMTIHQNNGAITQIDYFTNDQKVRSKQYNPAGQLSTSAQFDEDAQLATIDYYRIDGTVVLTKTLNAGKIESLQLFDSQGLVTHVFASEDELTAWWLQHYLAEQTRTQVLIGDIQTGFYRVLAKQQPDLTVIPVLTNLHQDSKPLKKILRHTPAFSRFLVQTEQDRQALATSTDRDLEVDLIENTQPALPKKLSTQE
ncbi:hypothetical protein [Lapidilactobacillus luobeiensis]|uniref:hypothetical protein n=1 Tax=Lapidilactobacillus luobeiensis TaxID=2950371 RepID=UPI0021C3FA3D|nr:hypothetical protein [Lapidilactobacillus luobeiensis]